MWFCWENIFWSASICSLLNGLVSVGAGDPSSRAAWVPRVSLSEAGFEGFQSAGLPCIFQHVSRRWPGFLQWSHHGLPFFDQLSLLLPWVVRVVRADELSVIGAGCESPIITFFLLSSRRISEKTSQMLGKGFSPSIRPRTSSKFLLSPIKNLKILFFSTISLNILASSGHLHVWSSKTSSCCQWRVRIL